MPYVRREGVDIHYEVTGNGPPVVLAHSLLCSGAMWAPLVPALSSRYLLVNVDARGHGASGAFAGRCTVGDLLRDHLAVLDAIGVSRATWAGLSMGGMVALRAALDAPDRVDSLVLLDTDAGPETLGVRAKHAVLALLARTVGVRPVLPQIAKLMFGPTTLRENPALVEAWIVRFAGAHVPSVLNVLAAVDARADLRRSLGRVAVPALVIVGAEDRSLPPERSRRLAAALPSARLVEVRSAGHLSALEAPGAVGAAMAGFLDEVHGAAKPAAPA
jgi:pimeloyl-ACP methyl ester carboxylesterase